MTILFGDSVKVLSIIKRVFGLGVAKRNLKPMAHALTLVAVYWVPISFCVSLVLFSRGKQANLGVIEFVLWLFLLAHPVILASATLCWVFEKPRPTWLFGSGVADRGTLDELPGDSVTEPTAPPNGGPATPLGNSRATKKPSSVS